MRGGPASHIDHGRHSRFTARVLQRPGQRYHVDRHGQLTLKQLRLSVLNEMHTNSYTGPRLYVPVVISRHLTMYAIS